VGRLQIWNHPWYLKYAEASAYFILCYLKYYFVLFKAATAPHLDREPEAYSVSLLLITVSLLLFTVSSPYLHRDYVDINNDVDIRRDHVEVR
jgi:hypothetical protein